MKAPAQSEKIEIRTTKSQKRLIELAAEAEGINVKAFIMNRVFPEAQRVLADRTVFTLNQKAWDEIDTILNRPPQVKAKLKKLLTTPSVLERRPSSCGRTGKD